MTELRAEEKVAAATITRTLGLQVKQYDDGTQPGMHDLNIITAEDSPAAVEVTAAADPDSLQLWKLVNGRGERWIVPDLHGGWMVHLKPTARAKLLLNELPACSRNWRANRSPSSRASGDGGRLRSPSTAGLEPWESSI